MPKVEKNVKSAKKYSEEQIQRALLEIKNGAAKKAVAKKYGIPRATLQFRLSNKFSKIERGPNPYLTKEEENSLVEWIIDSHRKGFPRRKFDIQLSVKAFLDADQRVTPFKDNIPGEWWYNAFLRRHPTICRRTAEAVTAASSNVSENDIRKWFSEIESYLKEKDTFSILEDPSRVYNGDETCFLFNPKLDKVIAPRGSKNVYDVDVGKAKQNLTVMFSFSASGVTTPPMIIYPNKRLSAAISSKIPDDWGIGFSDNGWMKAEIFVQYIENIFHPHLQKTGIEFPVILFVDGHATHLTLQLSNLCRKLQIILIALYPNSTRILQPADVACFRPLKLLWKNSIMEWRRENPFCKISKEHFAPILQKAVAALKPEAIINGFRVCGLQPWNPNSIDFSKCLGKNYHPQNVTANGNKESLSYADFCEIVGHNKISALKSGSESKCQNDKCDNFSILFNIFSHFRPNVVKDNTIHDNSSIEITELNQMPVDPHYQICSSVSPEIHMKELISSNKSFAGYDSSFQMIPENSKSFSTTYTTIHYGQEFSNHNLDNINSLNLSGFAEDLSELPIVIASCDNSGILDINSEGLLTYPDNSINIPNSSLDLSENKLIYTLNTEISDEPKSGPESGGEENHAGNTSISDFLLQALTPERRGQRQAEKMPYVLTSSGYKTLIEKKRKYQIIERANKAGE